MNAEVSGNRIARRGLQNPAFSGPGSCSGAPRQGSTVPLTSQVRNALGDNHEHRDNNNMTIAIYERVSGRSQRLDSQHHDLLAWAKGQEANGQAVKWYSDKFTGKTLDRPAMTTLLADLRSGRIQAVAVWRLDRLGRTAKGLTALFDELVLLKVNFVSLKDGIDLSTPAGRLIANVLASVAAYETEVRAERIAAGKAAKAAKIEAIVKAGGTPPTINKGGRPKGIPNKVTSTVANMILTMKTEKKKVTMIARELNLSRQTVYEVLRRDVSC
jgi:DNA invertase Pin-like site-specific DNA recombinase